MSIELLIAVFAGLAGMLGWGFADFFAKKTIDKVGSIVSLVWGHAFGTSALFVLVIFNSFILGNTVNVTFQPQIWLGLLFFGVLQAIVYLFAYEGFGKGQLALLNPIFASYSGLAAIISIVFFKEVINSRISTALIVIFIGVLLISLDVKGLRSKGLKAFGAPGLKEVGLAALMAAFWQVFWDKFLGANDWLIYTLIMYGFMTIAAFVMSKLMKASLKIKDSGLWKFLFLIGLGEAVAYLGLSLGFSATPYTSLVIVLAGAFSLPTIVLAKIFLKEKITNIQTFGAFAVIAGLVILSIS